MKIKKHNTPKQRAALISTRQAWVELRAIMAGKGWCYSRAYLAWVPINKAVQ